MFQNCDAYRLHRIDKYYENFQMDDTLKVVLLEDCNSSVLLGKGNYWLQEAGKGHDFCLIKENVLINLEILTDNSSSIGFSPNDSPFSLSFFKRFLQGPSPAIVVILMFLKLSSPILASNCFYKNQ